MSRKMLTRENVTLTLLIIYLISGYIICNLFLGSPYKGDNPFLIVVTDWNPIFFMLLWYIPFVYFLMRESTQPPSEAMKDESKILYY